MDITSFAWIVWLVLILIFVIIEMLTLDFVFLMIAVGSLGGLLSGLFGAPWWLQLLIAAILSVILIFFIRPPLLHALKRGGDPAKSNVDRLIGMGGVVVSTVTRTSGLVKLQVGETWTARIASRRSPELVPGEHVVVVSIEGATAVVAPAPVSAGTDGLTERIAPVNDASQLIVTIVVSVIVLIIAIFVLVTLFRSIRIIPQARAGVVERLGRYHKTLMPGLNVVVPFIDKVRPLIDMREQVVSFPPQPVITEDNLVVSIDTVVYFQVTDARAATYEIANYLGAVEQLTTTTLRNVVGGLNLEEALTSRDNINGQLRLVLDEATGKWGIRVSRVELKAIDPPVSIQDSMEKQMRAERDRRALILTAEGTKQSEILNAEGLRQAAILRAEGDAKAQVLRAEGEAQAITTVFGAIHQGNPDNMLLAYQYLQTLPKLADGPANKLWIIPSELTEALKGIGTAFGQAGAPRAGGPTEDAIAPQTDGGEAAAPPAPPAPPASAPAP